MKRRIDTTIEAFEERIRSVELRESYEVKRARRASLTDDEIESLIRIVGRFMKAIEKGVAEGRYYTVHPTKDQVTNVYHVETDEPVTSEELGLTAEEDAFFDWLGGADMPKPEGVL